MIYLGQTIAILLGTFLDSWLGDPERWPNAKRFFSFLVKKLEESFRPEFPGPNAVRRGGLALVIFIISLTTLLFGGALFALYLISPVAAVTLEAILLWQSLGRKSLDRAARLVYSDLCRNDLYAARLHLSYIVRRETSRLNEEGIAKAAVETIAAKTNSSIVAPLFYTAFFGSLGGFVYKAIDTMDSLLGYKDEKHIYFGRAAAIFDDVAGYLPARLTALIFAAAAWIVGEDHRGAFRIFRRDGDRHESPNVGQTQAALAGALGVVVGGRAVYEGKIKDREEIGNAIERIDRRTIRRALRLMNAASLIIFALVLLFRMLIILFVALI